MATFLHDEYIVQVQIKWKSVQFTLSPIAIIVTFIGICFKQLIYIYGKFLFLIINKSVLQNKVVMSKV